MDPKHLLCLSKIVDLGSLSRASVVLGVTQPTLSRIVKSIEDRVGAPVLRRGRYGVTPTEIGEQLAKEGRAILSRSNAARDAVERWQLGQTSEMRLGVGPMLAATVMGDFFASTGIRKWRFPLHVVVEYAARLIEALNQDQLDAAVLPSQLTLHQERLVQMPLFKDRLAVIASNKGRFKGHVGPVPLEELAQLPWVETAAVSGLFGAAREEFAHLGLAKQAPILSTRGDVSIALRVIAETDAIGFLPEKLMSRDAATGTGILEVDLELPQRDIAFWTHKSKQDRPGIRQVREALLQYVQMTGLT